MTEPSEAAKAKAKQVLGKDDGLWNGYALINCARFIQQVSDAAKEIKSRAPHLHEEVLAMLDPFILPEPVDPLTEALHATGYAFLDTIEFREALIKHGFTLVRDET